MRVVNCVVIVGLWLVGISSIACVKAFAGEEGNISKITPELNWRFDHDDAGRITRLVGPGGKERKINYKLYDKTHVQEVVIELSDSSKIRLEFDQFGRRVSMTDAIGTVRYEYDQLGHMTVVRREKRSSITYSYDTMDRLTSISVGDGMTTRYSYDFLGRLADIDTPAGKISYEYQAGRGAIIRTLPNGIRTEWEYNIDGSLKGITHVAKDNHVLLQFSYTYRSDGLISGIKELSPHGERVINYEYDTVQRLVGVTDSQQGRTTYRYDKFGNQTEIVIPDKQSVGSEYDWAGRMTKYNGQDCTHDAAGNLTSYVGKEGKLVFEFDGMDLLKTASKDNTKIEYQYDGDGYLVARKVDDKTTSFVADPLADIWRPLQAADGDGKRIFYIWEGDVPLATIEGKEVIFFLHDYLGSVRAVIDQQGSIIGRFDYTPFGEIRGEIVGKELQAGFAGLFYDPETLLCLTRARGYTPNIGRFLQRDPQMRLPTGSQKDFSAYTYCGGDPLNFVDVTGFAPEWVNTTGQFITNLPRTTSEGVKGIIDFYRPSNLAAGFRGGWEFGTPHPGTWADQAGRYGGVGYQRAVQGILGGAVAAEIAIPAAYIAGPTLTSLATSVYTNVTVGTTALIAKGIQYGGRNEPFHLPFLSDAVRYAWGNPHLGLGTYGWHLAMSNVHLYADRIWHPLTGSISLQYLPGFFDAIQNARGALTDGLSNQGNSSSTMTPWKQSLFFHPSSDNHGGIIDKDSWNKYPFPSPPDDHGGGGGAAVSGFGPLLPTGDSPFDSSNVGGVYLRGAGEALKGLGPLSGVAIDANNGWLALLAEEKGKVELPPLRLDDVVTIFRSVYEYGEAPFVSIDPDPNDPQGPRMFTRQGAGTKDTYPEWVLFESDRIMKAYSLGKDNISGKPVESNIIGYQNLFDLGFSNLDDDEESVWERFWIVPAAVNRRETENKRLTLLDVSLKVNTERMIMRDGKLEPAPNSKPSKSAEGFSDWFTKNYQSLSNEVWSQPPRESDINSPVAVYAELQRIALITAVAEALRDQGVLMPTWMKGYPVKACSVPPSTPAINVEVSKSSANVVNIQHIYGGVNLSASDETIHTMTSSPEAEILAKSMPSMDIIARAKLPVIFEEGGKRYLAASLPGNQTRDIGACHLEEVDITVPVQCGSNITLVRKFNSFFQPADVFGNGWTFDLPQLKEHREPTRRTGNEVEYKIIYQLVSPLNTFSERFRELKFVQEVKGQLLVPSHSRIILGIADMKDEKIGTPTKAVLFRDGRVWHFDGMGDLVAQVTSPLTVIYRRDDVHRVRRIEGWYGNHMRSNIQLEYDNNGRLTSVRGSNNKEVKYAYDQAGNLIRSEGSGGMFEYKYKDELVTMISHNGKLIREFEYDKQGHLMREQLTEGVEVKYNVNSGLGGVKITALSNNMQQAAVSAEYDGAMRPLNRIFPDGTCICWQYDKNSAMEATVTLPEGSKYIIKSSSDGRQLDWHFPSSGIAYSAEFDEAGRQTALKVNDHLALLQQWLPDGQMGSVTYETVMFHPEYGEDNLLKGLLITPPQQGLRFEKWLHLEYDELGRPKKMTDYSGSEVIADYDKEGEFVQLTSGNDTVRIKRNAQGSIEETESSWGYRWSNTYDSANGDLKQIRICLGKDEAAIEFDHNRTTKIRQFDGGMVNIAYYGDGAHMGQLKEVRVPNGVILSYDYDSADHLVAVDCDGMCKLAFSYDCDGHLTGITQAPVTK